MSDISQLSLNFSYPPTVAVVYFRQIRICIFFVLWQVISTIHLRRVSYGGGSLT